MLEKCVLTVLELTWNKRLGHKKTKLNICHHMLTSSTQLQNRSFHVAERTRTSSKCQKMKYARAKRAKILFSIVKYANLWGFCCRRRRGCLSSLKPGFHIIAPVATVVAVVEKRVLTQRYFLSDASDTVFPYDRRCRSIPLKLGRGGLGSITNFCARIIFGVIFKMPADANEGIEGIDLSFFKYLP